MQPADVSAMSNKTDARDREGRAGAPSVLEGAHGRAGNTGGEHEAGQEVAGAQGSTKRSARAQLNDTGGEGDRVCTYARTYVRTGGKVLRETKTGHRPGAGTGQEADSEGTEIITPQRTKQNWGENINKNKK